MIWSSEHIDRRTFIKYATVLAFYAGDALALSRSESKPKAGALGKQLDMLLGNSIIYEEYKGNFAKARALAQSKLEDARQSPDPGILADALLDLSLVQILQGEPVSAKANLAEIDGLTPNDPSRLLRALTFDEMASYLQYNTFPNWAGADLVDIEAFQGRLFTNDLGKLEQRSKQIRALPPQPGKFSRNIFSLARKSIG